MGELKEAYIENLIEKEFLNRTGIKFDIQKEYGWIYMQEDIKVRWNLEYIQIEDKIETNLLKAIIETIDYLQDEFREQIRVYLWG